MSYSRQEVESKLLKLFPHSIIPLDSNAIESINRRKNNNYGFSYLGLRSSCRPEDPSMPSKAFPQGMLYHDNHITFGIRIAAYQPKPGFTALVVIAPQAEADFLTEELGRFGQKVEEALPGLLLFVRHLNLEDRKALNVKTNLDAIIKPENIQWLEMDFTPWQQRLLQGYRMPSFIVSDDQEFGHRLLDATQVSTEFQGNITTRTSKRKKRIATFFDKNQITLDWHDLSPTNLKSAGALVGDYFQDDISQSFYRNVMLENEGERRHARAFCKLATLQHKPSGKNLPIGYFASEDISQNGTRFAIYSGFSHHKPEYVSSIVNDPHHMEQTHRFILWSFLQELRQMFPQIRHIDFGGSETMTLDNFKRDIGCQPLDTFWASSLRTARLASNEKDLLPGS